MKTTRKNYHKIIAALAVFAWSSTLLLFNDDGPSEYYHRRQLRSAEEASGPATNDEDAPNTLAAAVSNIVANHHKWPSVDMSVIPEGTYVLHNNKAEETANSVDSDSVTSATPYGRVLLYITTHMSAEHELFLRYCWPNMLARSSLLREADVAVYLNPSDDDTSSTRRKFDAMNLLQDTFTDNPNLKVYLRAPQGKNAGANAAMYEAVNSGFFTGYDWVIRLNPDVIVRDDSFLIQSMAIPALSAILINCDPRTPNVHTDFFVIRPKALSADTFPKEAKIAEFGFRDAIRNSVLNKRSRYRWIDDSSPTRRGCRAGYGRDYFESSIVHEHAFHPDMCEVPVDDDANVNATEVFNREWPEAWNRV